jgi:serine O-acetyltransferase
MWDRLKKDLQVIFDRDPAARSLAEVIFCYPGLHAIWLHRIAHYLWSYDFRFLGRFWEEPPWRRRSVIPPLGTL